MKKGIVFVIVMVAFTSCSSQKIQTNESLLALRDNLNWIEFSKLTFFTKELIQLGADTSFQAKFKNKLEMHKNIKQLTAADQQEYDLTLHLLYMALAAEKSYKPAYEDGKAFYLRLLNDHKRINFSVNENLIIQQIDYAKRGLTSGYDEGTTSESMFTFFCYDPLLFKKTLLGNGQEDDWKRIGIFLCNYLRENENPLALRKPMKQKIINMLSTKSIQAEFADVVKELKECDTNINLFD